MGETTVRLQDFGKDLGLMHEVIVTGRKAGATEEFYAKLAHDEGLFRQTVQFALSGGKIEEVVARPQSASKQVSLPEREPIFTVQLGYFLSKENMIATVKVDGHQFSDWSLQVIAGADFTLLTKRATYGFWRYKVGELTGIKGQNSITMELYDGVKRHGFCVAPDESACAIRRVYRNQPMNEWLPVLSEPRADASGLLYVLSVGRDSRGSWVSGGYANPGRGWDADVVVLVCRKLK